MRLFFFGWNADYPIRRTCSSCSTAPGQGEFNGQNAANYENPEYDGCSSA